MATQITIEDLYQLYPKDYEVGYFYNYHIQNPIQIDSLKQPLALNDEVLYAAGSKSDRLLKGRICNINLTLYHNQDKYEITNILGIKMANGAVKQIRFNCVKI